MPRLVVRVGTSVDSLVSVPVNTEFLPTTIDSPVFTAKILVRVDNYTDTQRSAARTTPYFLSKRRIYSIQVQSRFKHSWTADQILFGVRLPFPLTKLPSGSDLGLRIAKYIDPAIQADLRAESPFSMSPLICAVNVLNLGKVPRDFTEDDAVTLFESPEPDSCKSGYRFDKQPSHSPTAGRGRGRIKPIATDEPRGETSFHESTRSSLDYEFARIDLTERGPSAPPPSPETEAFFSTAPSGPLWLPPWTEGMQGFHLQEANDIVRGKAITSDQRKKWFVKERNRQDFTFTPNHIVAFDFFNPYLNLMDMTLKLPGISFDLKPYTKTNPLRYICESKDRRTTFFVIEYSIEN